MTFSVLSLTGWAVLLLLQSAANTFVSRSRNSGSYQLHLYASWASNGVWVSQQFISFGIFYKLMQSGTWPERAAIAVFYTVVTSTGSVGWHYIQKTYIETTAARKVGG
jgi:hypothetical protein